MRSPVFASFDRKALWLDRIRDPALMDIDKASIEAEINAMTEEDVSAALAQLREELSRESEERKEEDVSDPLPGMMALSGRITVTVEDELDPTNHYSMSTFEMLWLGIPDRPYQTRPLTDAARISDLRPQRTSENRWRSLCALGVLP